MQSWSNEFKVGLLAIFAGLFTALFILGTDDRPDGAMDGYVLYAEVPTAEGVRVTTQVLIAGVSVGSIRGIELQGGQARLALEMTGDVELPTDSFAELRSSGVLGDKLVVVTPGVEQTLLVDGDTLKTRPYGMDFQHLQGQLEVITEDVQAITAALRTYLEDEGVKSSLDATVKNLEQLSNEVRELSTGNKAEINAIARNLREVSESLNTIVNATGTTVEQQAAAIADATEKLNRSMDDINSITGKIDGGTGTLGVLLNDDGPVRQVEDTLSEMNTTLREVNTVVSSVSQLRTEIYYDGSYFIGQQPDSAAFAENPVHGKSRNVLGMQIMPREDYWYVFEFAQHPLGSFDFRQVESPDLGTRYTEYVRTQQVRFSFQFARRYDHVALRLGVKHSSGGVGADAYLWQDRVKLTADLYDFTYGSYPLLDGTPNLELGLRVEPYPHVFVQGGMYNVLLGARHGMNTGYVGAGIHFNDDDFKWILATLPSVP
ncbi:MAG: MCE family protein [Proteobacteria bacterium]|nr:MCE family protein [Pseudomonadota bacterium]MCP4918516.1 MCE family protein [Pseudomonadota bacterium]